MPKVRYEYPFNLKKQIYMMLININEDFNKL